MTKPPSPKADALRQMREQGPARVGAFKIGDFITILAGGKSTKARLIDYGPKAKVTRAASKPKRKGKK